MMLHVRSVMPRSQGRDRSLRVAVAGAMLGAIALCSPGCGSDGSGHGTIYDGAGRAHSALISSHDRWTRPGFGTVDVHGLPDGSFIALDSGIEAKLIRLTPRGKRIAEATSPWDAVICARDGRTLFATGLGEVAELGTDDLAPTVRCPMPERITERYVLSAPTDLGWVVLYPASKTLIVYERGTLNVLARCQVPQLRSAAALCFDSSSGRALITERGGSLLSVNPTTGEVSRIGGEGAFVAGDTMVATPHGVWVGSLDDRGSVHLLEHRGDSYEIRDVSVWGDGCAIVGSSSDGGYVVVARIPAGRTARGARVSVDVAVFRHLDARWLPFWETRIDLSGGVQAVAVGAHGTTVLIGTSGGVCHALSVESGDEHPLDPAGHARATR